MDWTPEQRKRVADAVVARRAALNLTQDEAIAISGGKPSSAVWSIIENAKQSRFKPRTLHGICAALDWEPDQIDRILRGEQPPTRQADVDDPQAGLPAQVAELLAEVTRLAGQVKAQGVEIERLALRSDPPASGAGGGPQ